MEWYNKSIESITAEIKTNLNGLTQQERKQKLENQGENKISGKKEKSNLKKFLSQFRDLLIYVLLFSAILKAFSRSYIDMTIILLVVIINALIGFIQERKAVNSLNGLTELMSETTTVLEEGEKKTVDSVSLVVGDIVLLSAGNIVPADIRLVECFNLTVEEAILTGESIPVTKDPSIIPENAGLSDRLNMVYSGTLVNSGSAKGMVVEVGDQTELGKISSHLNNAEDTETPLIKQVKKLNKQIFIFLAALMVVLFIVGYFFRDFTTMEIISALIALAVSAVPEGMPAVLSIILSVGVSRMAKQNAIIKKMPAVETLGSMSVICSDKTGTLTKNEMTVLSVITKDKITEIQSDLPLKDDIELTGEFKPYKKLVQTALYCNDTVVSYEKGQRKIIGNPTEGALLDLANRVVLTEKSKILHKIPFDSSYKYMAALVEIENEHFIFVKGAPDIILEKTALQVEHDQYTELTPDYWNQAISKYGSLGQRILAAAYKKVDFTVTELSHEDIEKNLVFLGLYGIVDPPKPAAVDAIKTCHEAGIGVKMITGDHKDTALAIAKEIGLNNHTTALVGSELEEMSNETLAEKVMDVDVYARTTPEHKLRIVEALQSREMIIGMTGDGVNDAPALKRADIGIAMGIKGTQVTKDAGDMVLADDNFSTIAQAVRVGRHVYDNLKKTIYFLIPTAFAQGLLVIVSILLNKPLPLSSVQILWINMVTAITLSFALGFEPAEDDIMRRKPRNMNENILDRYAIFRITYVAILIAFGGFIMNMYLGSQQAPTNLMQTGLMQTIIIGQIFYVINCRKLYTFSITASILTNKALWISIGILVVLQILVTNLPFFNLVLGTTPMTLNQLLLSIAIGFGVYIVVEIEKFIYRTFIQK